MPVLFTKALAECFVIWKGLFVETSKKSIIYPFLHFMYLTRHIMFSVATVRTHFVIATKDILDNTAQ